MGFSTLDAIVIGSGPNGLAAAITLAQAGCSVEVWERSDKIGGGLRTEELTLPGFHHDVCSAIHPLALASPFFRSLPLKEHGLCFVEPPAAVAHPLPDGTAIQHTRCLDETSDSLGSDGPAYRDLMRPFLDRWQDLISDTLSSPLRIPDYPVLMARFGLKGLRSARSLADALFRARRARALFAGHAAHSIAPLDAAGTASFGILLALLAHAVGWPLIEGGSEKLATALGRHLRQLGGRIRTGAPVASLRELPPSRVVLCDITPRQFVSLAGDRLAPRARDKWGRYRYGPGVFKMDWALSAPIPWRSPLCAEAGTVHVGGDFEAIAESEAHAASGRISERPFVLVAQQSLFDRTRAPGALHTAWAYCHVPHGCTQDMRDRIEGQIERFAPGFRDTILAWRASPPAFLEHHNPNYVGGDIAGGSNHLGQLLARPFLQWNPYATPLNGVYLCSSSTPPGGGVHGMCGYHAAQAALRNELRVPAIRPDSTQAPSLTLPSI